jgi:putative oxidoreductase
MKQKIFQINQIPGYMLIRLILGYVFLVAGLQKFIFPDDMGPGRFIEMGFPVRNSPLILLASLKPWEAFLS